MARWFFRTVMLAVLVAVATGPALAESNYLASNAAGASVSARLDFSIVIPSVLYLRIGAGSAIGAANNTTVNGVVFNVPANNLGTGTAVAATAGSGDLGNGAVTVRVFSNVGNVSLNSAVTGPMSNGAGDSLPWSQVTVAAAALGTGTSGFTNAAITHPAFNLGAGGGNGTATILTTVSGMVRREGQWTYSYANANTFPSGSYGGTVARNGRITYTATQL